MCVVLVDTEYQRRWEETEKRKFPKVQKKLEAPCFVDIWGLEHNRYDKGLIVNLQALKF